jgi:hypothetical protein
MLLVLLLLFVPTSLCGCRVTSIAAAASVNYLATTMTVRIACIYMFFFKMQTSRQAL